MAFKRKEAPEPKAAPGTFMGALLYCPKCFQKRYSSGGFCLFCGGKVPKPVVS